MRRIIGLLIVLFLANGSIVVAQNVQQWQQAYQEFMQKKNKPRAESRVKVATQLGETMYPKVEYHTATILVNHIKSEIGRAKGDIRKETEVKYPVLEACVNALKKITQPKALKYLLKVAQEEKGSNWRVRFYVVQALGGINDPEVISVLTKLINEPDAHVKIAAFDALTELKAPDATERACQLLKEDITWEIKIAAINYLSELNNQELIEPLINVIQGKKIVGRVRFEIVDFLKQLTGVDLGLRGTPWLRWWKKKQQQEAGIEPGSGVEETMVRYVRYYGIKATTTRVIFIMDISGSMSEPVEAERIEDPARGYLVEPQFLDNHGNPVGSGLINKLKTLKKKVDSREAKTRTDAAGRELINAIYNLDPAVNFTVILFSSAVTFWKDKLVCASVESKTQAIEYIMKNTGAYGATVLYSALELALKFIKKEHVVQLDLKANYVQALGGGDTIFIVTDGAPTRDKLVEPQPILDEIKKINQTRHIKIHTVAIGFKPDPNRPRPGWDIDLDFLEKLAKITGGVFADKTSKQK